MTSVIFAIILFLALGDPVFSCSKSTHQDIGKCFKALYLLPYIVLFCVRHQLEQDGFNIYMSQ